MLSKNTFYYILYTFFERSKALKNQRAHFFFFVLKFDKTIFFVGRSRAFFLYSATLQSYKTRFSTENLSSFQFIWNF